VLMLVKLSTRRRRHEDPAVSSPLTRRVAVRNAKEHNLGSQLHHINVLTKSLEVPLYAKQPRGNLIGG
jgi:hypothetical protein